MNLYYYYDLSTSNQNGINKIFCDSDNNLDVFMDKIKIVYIILFIGIVTDT
jgi:hypothetical protein